MLGRVVLSLGLVALTASWCQAQAPDLLPLIGRTYQAGPIRFTLPAQDFSGSPFDPDADLLFLLHYPALGLELKARGLYFQPGPGDTPEPVLDPERLRVEVDGLQALAAKELKRLGDLIPDLGVPIRFKEPRFNGFEGAKAGSVSFRIVLSLGGPLGIEPPNLLAIEASVTVYSSGKIELEGPLKATVDRPLPLGTTGLVLDGASLELRPGDRDETVRLTTHLAPAVGGRQGLSLDVTVRFGLPVRDIRFEGRLVLARREPLGRVKGTLSRTEVKGRLLIPDPRETPRLGELFSADLLFDMNKEGIQAEGKASVFRGVEGQVNLVLPFSGQGLLMAGENWRLLGFAVPANVTVHFAPGFKEVDLEADLTAEVDLEVLKVMASVSIHAMSHPRPDIEVTVKALGVTVRFHLDHMGQMTAVRLRAELRQKLADLYDNLVHALADLEKEGSELLAKAEKSLRGGVWAAFRQVGLERTCTGCKETDDRLAELASGRKNLIAWGVKSRCKACRWLAQAEPLPHPLLGTMHTLGKEVLGLLDAAGRKCRQEQAEREQRVEARLASLVQAINAGEINRTLDRLLDSACRAKNCCRKEESLRPRMVTRLHVGCDHAVSAAVNDRDGTLAFVITTTGFQCSIDPGRGGRCPRQHASDVQAGVVRFVGLLDERRRPRARIVLPELEHGSCLSARDYLRDVLAELIQRLLPEVEIEGHQLERDLAVRNGTPEPVRCWVQVLTRSQTAGQWAWQPAGPEQPEQTYSFLLPPGETVALQVNNVGLSGVAAHFRARSASGVEWTRYALRELWLVGEKDVFGRRCYQAGERATFLFDLELPGRDAPSVSASVK